MAGVGDMERDFDRQVRDALAHLYDLPYLRSHLLARYLVDGQPGRTSGMASGAAESAKALRRSLLEAIEQLRPGGGFGSGPAAARTARRHQLLVLRYVEALPAGDVQRQ